jgi:hypothetical protein
VLDRVTVAVDHVHPHTLDGERGAAVHQSAPGAGLPDLALEPELAKAAGVQRPSVVKEIGRLGPGRCRSGDILASGARYCHGARDPEQALNEVGHQTKLARRPRA